MFRVIQLFVFVFGRIVHRTIRIRPNSPKPLFGASLFSVLYMSIIVCLTLRTISFNVNNHCYTYNQLSTLCGMLRHQRITNTRTSAGGH